MTVKLKSRSGFTFCSCAMSNAKFGSLVSFMHVCLCHCVHACACVCAGVCWWGGEAFVCVFVEKKHVCLSFRSGCACMCMWSKINTNYQCEPAHMFALVLENYSGLQQGLLRIMCAFF